MKTFDDICFLLMKAHSEYRNDCSQYPQGLIGKLREERLISLLGAVFRSPKNPGQALTNLFSFVANQKQGSRLKNHLINACFEIFELHLPRVLPMAVNPYRNATNSYSLAFSLFYENSRQRERDQEEINRKIKEDMVRRAIDNYQLQAARANIIFNTNVFSSFDVSKIVADYSADQIEAESSVCPSCSFSVR